jgi:hypothetical protein
MKVRFTKNYTTRANPPETFEEDQEVDFAELRGDPTTGAASANHFINKGVAVSVEEERARARATAAPKRQATKAKAAKVAEAPDYEEMTVEELHKLAGDREIEGRSALTTKADLVKALEKADKESE